MVSSGRFPSLRIPVLCGTEEHGKGSLFSVYKMVALFWCTELRETVFCSMLYTTSLNTRRGFYDDYDR